MSVARSRVTLAALTVVALSAAPIAACGPTGGRPPETAPAPEGGAAPDSSGQAQPRTAAPATIGNGAVATLTEEELDRMRVQRVEELIAGRLPGVQVVRTRDGDYAIRVRGVHSLGPDGEPLYVVDGMPLRGRGLGGALMGIAPQDISRIEVLKDADALAAYGSQGANGVILITTKRRR